MNWLERARREIPNTPYKGTAKTAETDVSSVLAVPHQDISENSIPSSLRDDLVENIQEAHEERAAIREFDGKEPRKQAEGEARKAMRVYEYQLSDFDSDGPWLILLAPGCDLLEAERSLKNRFGVDRVQAVRERHHG